MGRRGPTNFQQVMPVTKVVKWLLISNVVIWFVGIIVLDELLHYPFFNEYLALTPMQVIRDFFIWEPFTYLFLHSVSPFHILLNMLLLWWVGSQLEQLWGPKFFALYYFVSGVGAAIIYLVGALIFSIVKGQPEVLNTPVVGASAAVFGLLMAYAIYFGEQVILVMFFFPMKVKYMVAIFGGIEVVMVLSNGLNQGKVANLAHVGGLASGYIFLKVWPFFKGGQGGSKGRKSRQNKLRLVVNNDELDSQGKPRYWN